MATYDQTMKEESLPVTDLKIPDQNENPRSFSPVPSGILLDIRADDVSGDLITRIQREMLALSLKRRSLYVSNDWNEDMMLHFNPRFISCQPHLHNANRLYARQKKYEYRLLRKADTEALNDPLELPRYRNMTDNSMQTKPKRRVSAKRKPTGCRGEFMNASSQEERVLPSNKLCAHKASRGVQCTRIKSSPAEKTDKRKRESASQLMNIPKNDARVSSEVGLPIPEQNVHCSAIPVSLSTKSSPETKNEIYDSTIHELPSKQVNETPESCLATGCSSQNDESEVSLYKVISVSTSCARTNSKSNLYRVSAHKSQHFNESSYDLAAPRIQQKCTANIERESRTNALTTLKQTDKVEGEEISVTPKVQFEMLSTKAGVSKERTVNESITVKDTQPVPSPGKDTVACFAKIQHEPFKQANVNVDMPYLRWKISSSGEEAISANMTKANLSKDVRFHIDDGDGFKLCNDSYEKKLNSLHKELIDIRALLESQGRASNTTKQKIDVPVIISFPTEENESTSNPDSVTTGFNHIRRGIHYKRSAKEGHSPRSFSPTSSYGQDDDSLFCGNPIANSRLLHPRPLKRNIRGRNISGYAR